jgi:polyisoprenoid-binding protein YceI
MPIKNPDTAVSSGTWKVDPVGSTLEFRVKTLWGLTEVKGRFDSFSGTLVIDESGHVDGRLTVDVASLDTGNEKRDAHLRSADFFDVKAHPTLDFSVTAIEVDDNGSKIIRGNLHVGERAVGLVLAVEVEEAGKAGIRLRADGQVSRQEVGMSWNKLGMIRGPVQLVAAIELVRNNDGR